MRELSLQNCRLDGRYDIERLLGRGSYAEIYLAKNKFAAPDSPHQSVVVKALNVFLQDEPEADLERTLIENFQNEAVALDRVRHPNIISRLGHGTARDLKNTIFHYIVLEFLGGGELAQLCRREPLSFERTCFYLEQVCAGLDFAHSRGVIHRDIKPQNLLLTEDKQTVKIADFGVAKFSEIESPITRVGTNIYAAPEHSPLTVTANLGHNFEKIRLTPAADVYSLAKTVYTMLAGESPRKFANAPIMEFPFHIQEKYWAEGVLRVLRKATHTEPAARHQTVREFWQEIWQVKIELENDARDLKTKPLNRAPLEASEVPGFTPKAPALPDFDSMRNVQVAPPLPAELPSRPHIVVELDKKQEPPKPVFKNPYQSPNGNGAAVNRAETEKTQPKQSEPAQPPKEPRQQTRLGNFAKRTLVALVLLAAFSAVLAGTYNYLQNRGILSAFGAPSNPAIGREGLITNKDGIVNLRSGPGAENKDIGDLSDGSRVKVLNVKENWYEVQILERSRPKQNFSDADHGWMNKRYIDLQ